MPVKNFRVEVGSTFAVYDIGGVPGLDDQRRLSWQGVSVDFRYRFLDRDAAPFGLTLALETHADRIDETTAAVVRSYGTEFRLAIDRGSFRTSPSRHSISSTSRNGRGWSVPARPSRSPPSARRSG